MGRIFFFLFDTNYYIFSCFLSGLCTKKANIKIKIKIFFLSVISLFSFTCWQACHCFACSKAAASRETERETRKNTNTPSLQQGGIKSKERSELKKVQPWWPPASGATSDWTVCRAAFFDLGRTLLLPRGLLSSRRPRSRPRPRGSYLVTQNAATGLLSSHRTPPPPPPPGLLSSRRTPPPGLLSSRRTPTPAPGLPSSRTRHYSSSVDSGGRGPPHFLKVLKEQVQKTPNYQQK